MTRPRRGGRVDTVARVQSRYSPQSAGERDADPAAGAVVRCRGCGELVPLALAVSLAEVLERAGRARDGGSAWACRPCIAAARGGR